MWGMEKGEWEEAYLTLILCGEIALGEFLAKPDMREIQKGVEEQQIEKRWHSDTTIHKVYNIKEKKTSQDMMSGWNARNVNQLMKWQKWKGRN